MRYLGQPEIHDFDLAPRGDKDVGRLNVAVYDALGVRRIQRIRHLNGQVQKVVKVKRARRDLVFESRTLQVLHHQEWPALVPVDIVKRADVGMVQGGDGARLSLEALHRGAVSRQRFRQKLHRHRAAQAGIFGLIDDTHPAAAQHGDDPVMGDCPADHDSTRRCPIA
jgi:hypothetical protein